MQIATINHGNDKNTKSPHIPSLLRESATHLAVMAAAMRGTIYCSPPVNSNMITTNDTVKWGVLGSLLFPSSPLSSLLISFSLSSNKLTN